MINAATFINQEVAISVDRPIGSLHPEWGFIYPVNYGFVPGTLAADGEELDAYLLGLDEPVDSYRGRCIAIIHRLDDDDDKLVVVPDGLDLSDADIRLATDFQERFFRSVIER